MTRENIRKPVRKARPGICLSMIMAGVATLALPASAVAYDYTSSQVQAMINSMDVVDLAGAVVLADVPMKMDSNTTLKNATFIAGDQHSAIFNTNVRVTNITVQNVVFDANGEDVGLLIFAEVDTMLVQYCTFKNIGNTTYDKWGFKVGFVSPDKATATRQDFATYHSDNIQIRNCSFINNNTGTFEPLLLVNISGVVADNYFGGNTTLYADEVSIYPGSYNVKYWNNVHENSRSAAIGAKDSTDIWIHNNIVTYSADSYEAINMRDCVNSKVTYNTIENTGTGNWSLGIGLEDTTGGYDGWPRYNEHSDNVRVTDNDISGVRYGIAMAYSTANRDLDQNLTVIDNNTLTGITARPIRVGVDGVSNLITALYIRNNHIVGYTPPYGWIEAIQLYEVVGAVVAGNTIN